MILDSVVYGTETSTTEDFPPHAHYPAELKIYAGKVRGLQRPCHMSVSKGHVRAWRFTEGSSWLGDTV